MDVEAAPSMTESHEPGSSGESNSETLTVPQREEGPGKGRMNPGYDRPAKRCRIRMIKD